eukprot:scaffold2000_cov48-Attheya_sp.AAC.4
MSNREDHFQVIKLQQVVNNGRFNGEFQFSILLIAAIATTSYRISFSLERSHSVMIVESPARARRSFAFSFDRIFSCRATSVRTVAYRTYYYAYYYTVGHLQSFRFLERG